MDLNLNCSWGTEATSLALAEGMSAGVPAVATTYGGNPCMIEDGVNGYVVKQRDSEDLIQKIEKFLTLTHEQKMRMGLTGRAKVEREFDRKIVVEAYLKETEAIND